MNRIRAVIILIICAVLVAVTFQPTEVESESSPERVESQAVKATPYKILTISETHEIQREAAHERRQLAIWTQAVEEAEAAQRAAEEAEAARRAQEERERREAAEQQAKTSRPVQSTPAPPVSNGSRWDQLAQCESGGNWAANTGNGYSGGLQFHPKTWTGHGGGQYAPEAWQASRAEQIVIAERVLASQGWRAWPGCSRKFGWI